MVIAKPNKTIWTPVYMSAESAEDTDQVCSKEEGHKSPSLTPKPPPFPSITEGHRMDLRFFRCLFPRFPHGPSLIPVCFQPT